MMQPNRASPAGLGGRDDLLGVFATVESFDLPEVRLNAGVLQFLDGPDHERGANVAVVGLLVAVDFIKLGFLGRHQQFKHEQAAIRVREVI